MIIVDTWVDRVYHPDIDTINQLMERLRKAEPGTRFDVSLMQINNGHIKKKRFTCICKDAE